MGKRVQKLNWNWNIQIQPAFFNYNKGLRQSLVHQMPTQFHMLLSLKKLNVSSTQCLHVYGFICRNAGYVMTWSRWFSWINLSATPLFEHLKLSLMFLICQTQLWKFIEMYANCFNSMILIAILIPIVKLKRLNSLFTSKQVNWQAILRTSANFWTQMLSDFYVS